MLKEPNPSIYDLLSSRLKNNKLTTQVRMVIPSEDNWFYRFWMDKRKSQEKEGIWKSISLRKEDE